MEEMTHLSKLIKKEEEMPYEYKVVPFRGELKSGESTSNVSSQLTSTITTEATDGWEFYQLGEVAISVKPGCLAGLLGGQSASI